MVVHWYTVTQLLSCEHSASLSSSIYIAVVHWYTVTQLWSCAPSAGSDQVQFILRWYTGTLSHISDLCTLCWLQSSSIYIAVVHWYTVTQLRSIAPSAGYNQDIYCAVVHWHTVTLSHNSAFVHLLLASINVNLYCGGTLVHCNTTLILCNICWLQSGYIYTSMVHWYTVTQLCYCAPSAGHNQYQYILRWYTGTLSHNSALVHPLLAPIKFNLYCSGTLVHCHTTLILSTLLPNHFQFILRWYTGTRPHNSALVHPLLDPIKFNLYYGGTLVHCHTTLICAPSAGSNQVQFKLRWYTGTLSHSSDLVDTLFPYQLQFILWWYTGTLSHNSDLVFPLLPPSTSILIAIHRSVIWSNQAQFILRWYTGTLSHNTDLCTLCWLLSRSIYIAVVHCHTTLILCTLCWLQSRSIYIAEVHWYTVTQLWSVHPLLAPIKINLYCGGTLVHCHTTLIYAPSAGHNQVQFILQWYTGTLSHNSDLVDTLLPNQLQFIMRWYTGTLSHISDLVYPLLPPSSLIWSKLCYHELF
jgi:hypothetical protein